MAARNAPRLAHRFDGGEPRDWLNLLGGGISQLNGTFPNVIQVVVVPVAAGRYIALLDGENICTSRQPFLDGARVLLGRGHAASATIEMYRPGDRAWSLRASIGIAARLTVDEGRTDLAPWKAFSRVAVSPPMRQNESPATLHHLGAS